MSPKNLDQWLASIEAGYPSEIDLGLERVRAVACRMQLTDLGAPVITVAGTNGKGSTIAYMAAILQAAGYTVGAYTSPHFIEYNERVAVNGQVLDDDSFCQAFTAIKVASDALEVNLTYFEYGTLAALWIFKQLINQQQLDVVLLEVGLGGRLDAVNIVDPDIAVVTTVAIDHESWLGADRETIGVEKAGIYRSKTPAIYGEVDMPCSVQERIDALSTQRYQQGKEFSATLSAGGWCWEGKSLLNGVVKLDALPIPSLPFANAATAIQALQFLNLPITIEHYRQGVSKAALTGRFQQVMYQGRELLLDVAHNPHAAKHLALRVSEKLTVHPKRIVRCVVGMLADKDVGNTLLPLSEIVQDWYAGTLDEPRGLTSEALSDMLPQMEVGRYRTIREALQRAVNDAGEDDLILVVGSFFTVAEALKLCRETSVE